MGLGPHADSEHQKGQCLRDSRERRMRFNYESRASLGAEATQPGLR